MYDHQTSKVSWKKVRVNQVNQANQVRVGFVLPDCIAKASGTMSAILMPKQTRKRKV